MEKKIYKRLGSTNVEAQDLVNKGLIRSTSWIQAGEQFLGRGMGRNKWYSEPDSNITGSLVVFPQYLRAEEQFEISIMASLAVSDLLMLYFDEVAIKWPNDILLTGSKIGGLLVEHSVIGQIISHSVIGIGLNVNQTTFPPGIPNATSFKLELDFDFDLNEVSDLLLQFLEKRLTQLENRESASMKEEYLRRLFRFKQFAPYKAGDKWFSARIIDVDQFGRLMLGSENGEILKFGFKEVEFID